MKKSELEDALSKAERLLMTAAAANKSMAKQIDKFEKTISNGNRKLEDKNHKILKIQFAVEAIAATLHPNSTLHCGPVTVHEGDDINPEVINEPQTLSILRHVFNLTQNSQRWVTPEEGLGFNAEKYIGSYQRGNQI